MAADADAYTLMFSGAMLGGATNPRGISPPVGPRYRPVCPPSALHRAALKIQSVHRLKQCNTRFESVVMELAASKVLYQRLPEPLSPAERHARTVSRAKAAYASDRSEQLQQVELGFAAARAAREEEEVKAYYKARAQRAIVHRPRVPRSKLDSMARRIQCVARERHRRKLHAEAIDTFVSTLFQAKGKAGADVAAVGVYQKSTDASPLSSPLSSPRRLMSTHGSALLMLEEPVEDELSRRSSRVEKRRDEAAKRASVSLDQDSSVAEVDHTIEEEGEAKGELLDDAPVEAADTSNAQHLHVDSVSANRRHIEIVLSDAITAAEGETDPLKSIGEYVKQAAAAAGAYAPLVMPPRASGHTWFTDGQLREIESVLDGALKEAARVEEPLEAIGQYVLARAGSGA